MTSLADHGYAKLPLPPYDLRHPQMAVELNAFQAAEPTSAVRGISGGSR